MSEVVLTGVCKNFGDNAVVRSVDLAVPAGEFLVLVGPSGCGKTTLLRLIAGLERADAGEIRIDGRVVNEVAPRDRDVAMVFQSYALYPHMTVRENIAFGLALRRMPRPEIEARVAEVASLLEISLLLDRKPKDLSGGQRQRVAMGRAIVRRPKIFLFDEPLSNLDTALRVQMRGELARLHRRLAATMIYVTHDQVEAMTLASRVAALNLGRVQQFGPPLELYQRPANRFVAGFLGSPAMNFLEAQREEGKLVGKGFALPAPPVQDEAREVLVGLRPQDLRVSSRGAFTGQVDAVERLGFDGYAYLRTEAGPLTARFDAGTSVAVGDRVQVDVIGDPVHLFSQDGSRALRHPSVLASAPALLGAAP